MKIKINNRLPVYETAGLSLVAVGAFGGAAYQVLQIQGIENPFTSPVFYILLGVALILTIVVLKKRAKDRGALTIDTDAKTFALNNSPQLDYADLATYSSKLRTSAGRTGMSNMYITLGTEQYGSFSIMDIDRIYLLPKGRSKEELTALEELVAGSSLTEDERKSFEIFKDRALMVH
jgi:hypothetical protein